LSTLENNGKKTQTSENFTPNVAPTSLVGHSYRNGVNPYKRTLSPVPL